MASPTPATVGRMRHRAVATACIASALVLAGCSQEPAEEVTSTTTVTSVETKQSTVDTKSAITDASPIGEADMDEKSQRADGEWDLVPTDIRVGHHQGFDRVVVDFSGTGTPGYFVSYTDAPTQQASGYPLVPAGDSYLEVAIDGTTYPFEVGAQPESLATTPDLPVVKDVADGGTFEGRSQYIIGINGPKKPFAVKVLDNPTRLAIDIITD